MALSNISSQRSKDLYGFRLLEDHHHEGRRLKRAEAFVIELLVPASDPDERFRDRRERKYGYDFIDEVLGFCPALFASRCVVAGSVATSPHSWSLRPPKRRKPMC